VYRVHVHAKNKPYFQYKNGFFDYSLSYMIEFTFTVQIVLHKFDKT
jgi:hypothetical protein